MPSTITTSPLLSICCGDFDVEPAVDVAFVQQLWANLILCDDCAAPVWYCCSTRFATVDLPEPELPAQRNGDAVHCASLAPYGTATA